VSGENVELVRRQFEAFNEGDDDDLVDAFAEDAELWAAPEVLEGGRALKGRDQIRRFFAEVREAGRRGAWRE